MREVTSVATSATYLSNRRTSLALALVTLVIGVISSWIPSIWADEGATISGATRGLPDLWRLIQSIDAVHATYYVLLNPWLAVFGIDAFWLRLPSALATGAAAFVLHRLALRLVNPTAALLAGLVFAVLPRVTWMAIEGRSSAFSTLAAIVLSYLLVRWLEDRRGRWLVGYAAVLALGVALHVYLALLLGVHLVLLVLRRPGWPGLLRWALASAAGVAAVSPLVLLAAGQTGQVGGGFPVDLLTGLRQIAINQFFLGERPLPTGDLLADSWQYAAVALALGGFVLVVGAALVNRRSWTAEQWHLIIVAVVWAVLPSLVVLLTSVASGRNLYHPRYFAYCAPGVALLLGLALAGWVGWRRVVALALVVTLTAPVYLSQRGVNAKTGADWSQLVAVVAERSQPGEGIYFSFSNRIIAVAYPAPFRPLTDITLLRDPVADGSLAGSSRPLAQALADAPPEVIWAVYRLDRDDRVADEKTFTAAGYRPFSTWRGTWDELVGYRRERR